MKNKDLDHLYKSDTKCRARTRKKNEEWPDGIPCALPAGYGTDHSGKGRCKYHGGKSVAGPEHYRYKTGLTSRIGIEEMRALAEEYEQDPDIFNFRDVIAMIKAALTMAINGNDAEKAVNYAMQLTRAVERLSNIEVSRGYYMKVTEVEVAIDMIAAVIQGEIKDKDTYERIASRLARLNLLGDKSRVINPNDIDITHILLEDVESE